MFSQRSVAAVGSKVKDRLIIFDVEGVLIPKVRFILFEVIGRIGIWSFFRAAFFGLLYEIGLITLKDALKNIYKLLEGLPLERLISRFQGVPLMPGVDNLFKDLKKAAYKIVLISSGIPSVALESMAEKLGADYFSGLEIGLSEGLLTGEIWGDVIEAKGKAAALERILTDEDLSPSYCIGVADDRNNLSMFELVNLRIGYNPDYVLSRKSDHVIKGDLSKIIHLVKGEQVLSGEHNLSEISIIRKAIHTSGFLVSIVSAYLINHDFFGYSVIHDVRNRENFR
jgi:phosphoserine phosphatase